MKHKTSAWRLVGTALSQSKIFLTHNAKSAAFMLAGAVLFALVFFLIHLPHGPEHWSADLRTALLSERRANQYDRIALVEVTNETLEYCPQPDGKLGPQPNGKLKLGRCEYITPIDRKLLAELIRTIDAAEPTAIGLDFIFDRATETSKDDDLLSAITDARAPIVLGALDDEQLTGPEREFQSVFLRRKLLVGHLYLGEQHTNPVIIGDHVISVNRRANRTELRRGIGWIGPAFGWIEPA